MSGKGRIQILLVPPVPGRPSGLFSQPLSSSLPPALACSCTGYFNLSCHSSQTTGAVSQSHSWGRKGTAGSPQWRSFSRAGPAGPAVPLREGKGAHPWLWAVTALHKPAALSPKLGSNGQEELTSE